MPPVIQIGPGTGHQSWNGAATQGNRLDSGGAPGPWSRWSYALGPARIYLRCDAPAGPARLVLPPGRVARTWDNPLEALAWMTGGLCEAPAQGPPFKGGWVGYLSYELGAQFERIRGSERESGWPLFEFTFHSGVLARDMTQPEQLHSIVCDAPADGTIELPEEFGLSQVPLKSNFTRPEYEAAVARAVEYIRAGDVFQVNLSQRFSAGLRDHPREIYDRLSRQSPAWFGAYLSYGSRALLCNSPELFLRVTPDARTGARHILTRPIKGTRPRAAGLDEQLQNSAKDQAELNMIVDLERNYLGRICQIGTVKVSEPRTIEAHPTVYHGVAGIEGVLRDDVTFVDLLRATFPGGSVTGAPKIRAMEIINELEPTGRGPYCGAIGYLSVEGHMEFNIAIRTMIAEDDTIHVPVGGGIVADSLPAEEYEETLVKARAMLDALGVDYR